MRHEGVKVDTGTYEGGEAGRPEDEREKRESRGLNGREIGNDRG